MLMKCGKEQEEERKKGAPCVKNGCGDAFLTAHCLPPALLTTPPFPLHPPPWKKIGFLFAIPLLSRSRWIRWDCPDEEAKFGWQRGPNIASVLPSFRKVLLSSHVSRATMNL